MHLDVRKTQLTTERVVAAGGLPLPHALHRGAIAAVLENPFAGTFADADAVTTWMRSLRPLADSMAEELRDALGRSGDAVETYGKGAIVGAAGELEIAAAWHVPAGAGLRAALGDPKAQVPSSKKVGAIGATVDIPLVHIHASYLRSHYDVMPVVVPDAPTPTEVVYALVMSTGPRPHHRIGGFSIDEIEGADGLR